MKAGIAKIPFVGTACRAAGFIFVDNSTPKAAARSVLEAERCLRNGASVVVSRKVRVRIPGNDPFQERGLSNGARSAFAYYSDHLKRAV